MKDAVAAYHELLADDRLAASTLEGLREGQAARRLAFGERPLSVALRPQILSKRRYQEAVRASQAVYSALQALERALLQDQGLRAELDLDAEEERLALADPGCRSSSPSARLDSFFADRVRYVEYNAESPAGMAYGDNLAEVFAGLPVMRAFRRRFPGRFVKTSERQLAAMLRAFRQWGRDSTPVIAIVDSKGRLHAGGAAVNLVYRRVLTSELLARADETRALRDAYLAGAVCVVNTFRAKLLHKKMSLALLSDPRYQHLYTPAQRAAIRRHVPWTRRVRPRLAERVARRRDHLVLKPNDEYGGKGVVLGWTVDQAEWEAAVEVAQTQSYVVQEAVKVPRERYPIAAEGVHYLDLAIDLDPYLFDGRAAGCLTRLSAAALLNVTAGAGSVVPTFVLGA
ncbi:MAG: hypothetical protein E6I08_13870 [Chloroflexi bacterium]|nr:MAG: hypothetical protein E6I08_13870 [Chloroflexota bacterium]